MTERRVSDRLRRYVLPRFGAGLVDRLEALAAEGLCGRQAAERILTAVVRVAGDDLSRLEDAVALARTDWRDLLVAAGLAHEDWPERLDRILA